MDDDFDPIAKDAADVELWDIMDSIEDAQCSDS